MPKGQNIFELAKWLDEGVSVQKIESLNEIAVGIPLQKNFKNLIDQGEVKIKMINIPQQENLENDSMQKNDSVMIAVTARSGKVRWVSLERYKAMQIPVSQEFLDKHHAPESFWTDDCHA